MRAPLLPVLLLLLAATAGPVRARGDGDPVGRPFWVITPSEVPSTIDEARGAVVARDWTAAAEALQQICERFPRALAEQPGGRYVGARAWALDLLATMPDEVRAEYERLFGRPAQAALRRALASGERAALVDVVRRYEPARAGLDAILALADRALLRGEAAEARLWLARVADLHADHAGEAGIAARAALAAARDHAGGGPPPTGPERRGEAPAVAARARPAWPMLQGDARRSAVAPPLLFRELQHALLPEVHERMLDTPPRPLYGGPRGLPQLAQDEWNEAWLDYDPLHPVIARGALVHQDGSQLFAHNLYSGRLLWRHPVLPEPAQRGRTNVSALFSPVIADGVVYAALESEQDYRAQQLQGVPITYYIPERRLVAVELETGRVLWEHTPEVVAEQAGRNPLYRLSVVGPPLVRGDTLYAPAVYSEGTFHHFLLALDRRTGAFLYATRISIGQQELNLFGRQLQEAAATAVAEADGSLYYATNQGVVAAVDALLGAPLWLATYPWLEIPKTYLWYEAPRRWPRFENGAPIVAGDLLLVAPTDAEVMLALDRDSGRPVWSLRWSGGRLGFPVRTLQAADEERVYVSGESGVAALWLRDDPARDRRAGGVAWKMEIGDERDRLTGRGLLSRNGLWIPSRSYVYAFDPVHGKVVDRVERLGADADMAANLVWGDGVLVTAGKEVLGVRYDEDDVVALARERVEAHPGEIAPLLEAADVFRSVGRIGPAVEYYRDALDRATERGVPAAAARARDGLHRSLLRRAEESLRTEPDRAPADFEAAFRAAPDPSMRLRARRHLEELLAARTEDVDREWRLRNLREIERHHGDRDLDEAGRDDTAWALRRMADVLLELQQPRDALEVLHRLVESDPEGPSGHDASERIGEVLRTYGRRHYDAWERRARRLFEQALESGDLATVEHGLRLYANSVAAEEATLALAAAQRGQGRAADATRLLQRFLADRPRSSRVPRALQAMARALHDQGLHAPAYQALQRLLSRHADARLVDGQGRALSAQAWAEAWLAREPYPSFARQARERTLQGGLTLAARRAFPESVFVDIPEVLGMRPPALDPVVFVRASSRIVALRVAAGDGDGDAGEIAYRLEFGEDEPQGALVLVGERILAVSDRRIHVFDAVTGAPLVRTPVPDGGRGLQLLEEQGQVFLLYQEGRRRRVAVAALHPAEGRPLWTTTIPVEARDERVLPNYTVAMGDRVLVLAENPVRVTSVHATSGAIEGRVLVDTERNTRIAVPPLVAPDGRLLLGLGTSRRIPGVGWEHSHRVALIDPARPGAAGLVWRHEPPEDRDSRWLRSLQVSGGYVVALDESRGATVLDTADGTVHRRVARLPIGGLLDSMPNLATTQPHHDSMLLVLTNPLGDEPARLTAYTLPDLERRYSMPVADHGREEARVIPSSGLLGLELRPRDETRTRPRIRLIDPAHARMVQEITPPTRGLPYLIASVQNGILVVATQNLEAFAYAPR